MLTRIIHEASTAAFVIIESALGKKCGLALLKIPHFNLEM
jgi:hypothetical protein